MAEPAADQQPRRPKVGSVADEAARLTELLGERRPWFVAPDSGSSRDSGPDAAGRASAASAGTRSGGHENSQNAGDSDGTTDTCTCGGKAPTACRACPVCQVIGLVQSIKPETIEKVADLIGFAATALRDYAEHRREQQAGEPTGPDAEGHSASGPAAEASAPGDRETSRGRP